jgi:hypothetical protein
MRRSPSGVAMGVSGDAQTGHNPLVEYRHCQRPFVQTAIRWLHADGGQARFGVSQALPRLGMYDGHGAASGTVPAVLSQAMTSEPMGWPLHGRVEGPIAQVVSQLQARHEQSVYGG